MNIMLLENRIEEEGVMVLQSEHNDWGSGMAAHVVMEKARPKARFVLALVIHDTERLYDVQHEEEQ